MKLTWLVAASGLAFATTMYVPAQAAPGGGLRDFAPAAQQMSEVEQTHYRRYRHRHYRYYRSPGVHFYLGHRHRHHRHHRHW